MNIEPVPDSAIRHYRTHRLVDMGRPAGVAEADCGSAPMLLGDHPAMPGFAGRDQRAFFKPTAAELEILNAGGYVVMNQIGTIVQPFAVSVWPADQGDGKPR